MSKVQTGQAPRHVQSASNPGKLGAIALRMRRGPEIYSRRRASVAGR